MPVALHVSPHPDDELIGAGATLSWLRDEGWRVVNLACGLGTREADRERRRDELVEACARAGFELEILDGDAPLADLIAGAVARHGGSLLVGPSARDGHPAHEAAGSAILDVLARAEGELSAWLWGLWADLPRPTLLVTFDERRLQRLQHALAAHAGELARNDYARLVRSRAETNAVLGAERVFGFGTAGTGRPYAELLSAVRFEPGTGIVHEPPRRIDA